MALKRWISLLVCLGLLGQVQASVTRLKLNDDDRLDFSSYVKPGQSSDFKLKVSEQQSILKINGQTYRYGKLDFVELVTSEDSCITATGLKLNNREIGDVTLKSGQKYQKSFSDMQRTYKLEGKISSDMVLVEDRPGISQGQGSEQLSNFDKNTEIPVVPAPGAIILGTFGLLILSRLRKIV